MTSVGPGVNEIRVRDERAVRHWLEKSRVTQAEAAKVLGVTQARVSEAQLVS
jgi:predicted XRE-type DNA-binding protein